MLLFYVVIWEVFIISVMYPGEGQPALTEELPVKREVTPGTHVRLISLKWVY